MNVYAEHQARRDRIMPALEGTGPSNRRSESELIAALGPTAGDDAMQLAATGAIRGNSVAGYYLGRSHGNGRDGRLW